MDKTFLLFCSREDLEKVPYLNKRQKNISFTSEMEQNGSLSFLDIKINRENNKFVTSVYRKSTFSGIFKNFESFILKYYNRNLIYPLLYRAFSLCSNMENFHQEISSLK